MIEIEDIAFENFLDENFSIVANEEKQTKEEKAQEILQISGADFNENVYPSAKYLIKKSVEKFNRKDFEDVAYFEPFYLKDFHGIKKKS